MTKNSGPIHNLLDDTVEKIDDKIHDLPPTKRVRNSQILTGVFGLVGFAMFMEGISKLMQDVPYLTLILVGIVLMTVSGVLLQKLLK